MHRIPEHPHRRPQPARRARRPTRTSWPSGSARRRSSSDGWRPWPPRASRSASSSKQNVALFNGKPGDPASFDLLDELLDAQAYRLSFWRVASDEINYRRFFDINDLAALSMERPEVFEATHGLVLRLLREGKIDGLRIDHPDGLYDPEQYLRRLQRRYALDLAEKAFDGRPRGQGPAWEEVREPVRERTGESRRREGRWGGRSTSSSRRSSARASRCRRTGRSTAPAATTSSTGQRPVRRRRQRPALHAPVPRLGRGRSALRRDGLPEEDADPAGVAVQRAAHADLPARPAGAEEPLVARLHLQQPAAGPAGGDRLLPRLPLVHRRTRGVSRRATAATSSAAVRRAKRAQPGHHGGAVPLRPRHAAAGLPGDGDGGGPGRAAALRRQVPAGDGAGDGQGGRGHGLLRLQPAGVAQRGRRRPRPVRRAAGRACTASCRTGRRRGPASLSPLSTHDTKRSEDVRARINVLSEIPDEWRSAWSAGAG